MGDWPAVLAGVHSRLGASAARRLPLARAR